MDIFIILVLATLIISIFLLFYLIYLLFFLFPLFFGAPFVPTSNLKLKDMFELAAPKPGEILYDLGSGNGKIVIEAAKNYGAKAIGIDINPLLVYFSRKRINKIKLGDKAKIYYGNFFKKNISDADIVITYLLQWTNNKLEKKLLSELKPGARIVSLAFTFKNIPLVKFKNGLRLYQIPK